MTPELDPPTVPLPAIDPRPPADPRLPVDAWSAPPRPGVFPAAPGPSPAVPGAYPVAPGQFGQQPRTRLGAPFGGEPGSWTALDVLSGLGAVLLLSLVLSWPFSAYPHAPHEVQVVVAGFLPIWLALGGACWLASRGRGTGRLAADLGLRLRWVNLALGLGLGVGLRIGSGIIALIVQTLFGRSGGGNLDQITGGGLSTASVVINLIIGGSLIAPVIEELFFRGLLLRSVMASLTRRGQRRGQRRNTDNTINTGINTGINAGINTDINAGINTDTDAAVGRRRRATYAASAVLFALLHLSEVTDPIGALTLMATLLLVGWVHAIITWSTGRLGSAVVSHVVFNASAALLLLVH